jgi:hypothetical protein
MNEKIMVSFSNYFGHKTTDFCARYQHKIFWDIKKCELQVSGKG